jgi:hypothetical protein
MYADGSFGTTGTGAIGIVFSNMTSNTDYNNGYKKGYVLALKNAASAVAWGNGAYSTSDAPGLQNNITWALWSGDLDGLTETNQLKAYGLSSYPAAYYAVNYNVAAPSASSGWYLPSSGQWYQIITNLCGMNGAITSVSDMWGPYWSYAGKSGVAAAALNSAMSAVGSGNYSPISNTENTYGHWYWCTSDFSAACACCVCFYYDGNLNMLRGYKTYTSPGIRVRAVLAF